MTTTKISFASDIRLGRADVDHFDLYAKLRASKSDSVRDWAELEGKSATMSEDLYRQAAEVEQPAANVPARITLVSKVIAAIVQAWFGESR